MNVELTQIMKKKLNKLSIVFVQMNQQRKNLHTIQENSLVKKIEKWGKVWVQKTTKCGPPFFPPFPAKMKKSHLKPWFPRPLTTPRILLYRRKLRKFPQK
jgi:hypothetical protein